MRRLFLLLSTLTLTSQGIATYYYPFIAWSFIVSVPIVLLGLYEMIQVKRTLMRNYPIVGRFRYWMELLRPKIYQYFIESDTDGTPISRIFRSIIYQRAKGEMDTTPFGTQLDVDAIGYEWINHSMNPLEYNEISMDDMRVIVGGSECLKPYSCSIFNISAMSYGALSSNAIRALNWGANTGKFAHNTGEGSISDFHRKHGGDLIWQIGTGYFGCRNKDGTFCEQSYIDRATDPQVKMIEIKLSQGAKPGHGGILPAGKNSELIAKARGVEPWTNVISPPKHSAFSNPKELMLFIKKLRELSGGKPVGFKFCFGIPGEFEAVCHAMLETGIKPDFIAVDGGEGGTGAAPLEFSNSIGMSLRDGLIFTTNYLTQYGLRDDIKIFASGKMLTGFHIVRALALGADVCYSARGMMMALGCIQALECNSNHCPTGIATQNPQLVTGLVVADKYKRVANYHHHTIESVQEILAAAGLSSSCQLKREHIWRRVAQTEIKNYEELFPTPLVGGTVLHGKTLPSRARN